MKTAMAVLVLALSACRLGDADGEGPLDAACRYVETGECARPAGTDLGVTPLALETDGVDNCLLQQAGDLTIASSQAEWDALFQCPVPLPDGVDFSTSRLAVIQVRCVPTDFRFAVETSGEIVIGVFQRIAGACIDPPVVVRVPRSVKPLRLARCVETGEGDCPPRA